MKRGASHFNSKQLLFKELFVGTLIYAVVLGFLNDYTSLVDAKSFSTIFYASVALQLLTMLAFWLKGKIVEALKPRPGPIYRVALFFSVWAVMFVSKFIFIWVIDVLFGDYIAIEGFFGILIVVVLVTLVHRLADRVFMALATRSQV